MRYATFHFSPLERGEIVKAWLLTSLAFAIFFLRTGFFDVQEITFTGFALVFLIAAVTAGLGFVLHELCHKLVAHRFGVYGEFRANGTMLVMSVVFALMGFIFAAPGAVHLFGNASRRAQGLIAAAGPACNMALALLFLPLAYAGSLLGVIGAVGLLVNAILGAFNLIPFLGLDGQKIFAWHKGWYAVMVIVAAALVVLAYA